MIIRTTGIYKLMDRNIKFEGDTVGDEGAELQLVDGSAYCISGIRTICSVQMVG